MSTQNSFTKIKSVLRFLAVCRTVLGGRNAHDGFENTVKMIDVIEATGVADVQHTVRRDETDIRRDITAFANDDFGGEILKIAAERVKIVHIIRVENQIFHAAYFIAERNHFYRLRRKTSMSAKKSKTFFKTLTAILVLLLFFGGYYIYSSGIFGASVTENISEHSITDEERLIEYEEYGITYDESSQSYLYQDSLIKNLRDGDFLYTNAAGSIKLIIQRDDNGHIQSIDVE